VSPILRSKHIFFNGVRFGAVEEIVSRPNGSYLVRFSQRSEAEAALAGARFFESKPVLMDWFEDAAAAAAAALSASSTASSSGSIDHAVKQESEVHGSGPADADADANPGESQAATGDDGELGDGVYEGDAAAAVAGEGDGEAAAEDDSLYAGL
jgi:hypothetical protein